MRHQVSTETHIAASPQQVWAVLSDLPSYADWSPFVVEAEGTLRTGERLRLRLQPPGRRATGFRPVVTELVPGSVLEWLGRLGVPGLFDGRHRFELHPTDDGGTRLVHAESFRGLLVRPARGALDGPTREGFLAFNEALARRVAEVAEAPEVAEALEHPEVADAAEAAERAPAGTTTQPVG
jgi:hypothetical protein